jgi:very-short-patch-repair endonuclease
MWAAALQSDLELRVLEEIERQGLPRPTRQCPLILADRSTIHLDFGWPDYRVGLEVDHPAWHDGQVDRQRDGRRDRAAAMEGWVVLRVAKLEVDWSLSAAITEVGVILRRRGWRG